MSTIRWRGAGLCVLLWSAVVAAEPPRDRLGVGGYLRLMTRPDFQGGDGRLGYWNLYGRLLNEGPYAMLDVNLDVIQAPAGTKATWAEVHTRVEGNSISNADPGRGNLQFFRVSQLFVRAGNLLLDDVTWQLGTLENWFGDLGLYDLRPATLFFDTLGLSMTYRHPVFDVLLGVGDSGYSLRGLQYSTVLTGGGSVRVRLGKHVEFGGGAQWMHEPRVPGNRFAPYYTPGVRYEDVLRGEVVQRWLEENPGQEILFPDPVATSSASHKYVGYLGFGNLGPIVWNNLFVSWSKLHPRNFYTEEYQGRTYNIYLAQLSDERYSLQVGNEMQLRVIPQVLDVVWSTLYGYDLNLDNTVAAGEDNREYLSTVVRTQLYLTRTVHWLTETSLAREKSLNGNLYRQHVDSVFRSTGGVADLRGLQYGDTDTRYTWQLKAGFVLNPTGTGIFSRPSLRLLYGLQYSNQHAAFGSGFVESLDQFNIFIGPERHWHSVVALEAEAWF